MLSMRTLDLEVVVSSTKGDATLVFASCYRIEVQIGLELTVEWQAVDVRLQSYVLSCRFGSG